MIGSWILFRISLSGPATTKISPLEMDKLIWKGDDSGCFMVKAYFNLLEGVSPLEVSFKMLWNPHIPSKVGFFVWKV